MALRRDATVFPVDDVRGAHFIGRLQGCLSLGVGVFYAGLAEEEQRATTFCIVRLPDRTVGQSRPLAVRGVAPTYAICCRLAHLAFMPTTRDLASLRSHLEQVQTSLTPRCRDPA